MGGGTTEINDALSTAFATGTDDATLECSDLVAVVSWTVLKTSSFSLLDCANSGGTDVCF